MGIAVAVWLAGGHERGSETFYATSAVIAAALTISLRPPRHDVHRILVERIPDALNSVVMSPTVPVIVAMGFVIEGAWFSLSALNHCGSLHDGSRICGAHHHYVYAVAGITGAAPVLFLQAALLCLETPAASLIGRRAVYTSETPDQTGSGVHEHS